MIKTIPIAAGTRVNYSYAQSNCGGQTSREHRQTPSNAKSFADGSIELRDPARPHKGNHIDAQPYWIDVQEVSCEGWRARRDVYNSQGCLQYRYDEDGRTMSAIGLGDLSYFRPSPAIRQATDEIAVTKALAALRSADASIPMMLRERAQTAKMLGTYGGRVADAVRRRQLADVKRYKQYVARYGGRRSKALLQMIANEHLMFIFGLMPLISEAQGLAKHITREEYTFIRGRGRHTYKNSSESYRLLSNAFSQITTVEDVYSVRVSLRADISLSMGNRAQKLGFNPLYTWWDFTPLSFVLGWVSNLNHFVQALDPLVGSNYRTGAASKRSTRTITRSAKGITASPPGGGFVSGQGEGKSTGRSFNQTREVLSSSPKATLHYYNNTSFFAATAAASLVIQRALKPAKAAVRIRPFRYKSPKRPNLPDLTYS